MSWRRPLGILIVCALGSLTAYTPSDPLWLRTVIICLGIPSLFCAAFLLLREPEWKREHPRLFERLLFGTAAALLIAAAIFLLGEAGLNIELGRGTRSWLFFGYVISFLGAVAILRRLFLKRPMRP